MANGTHELQERYASLVDAKLRKTLVTKDGVIFNNRYEGAPCSGAVKIPVRDGEVALGAYDIQAGKDLSTSTTKYITVTMKDVAGNELVDKGLVIA